MVFEPTLLHGFYIFFGVLIAFLLVLVVKSTYVVNQAEVIVIERLGRFHAVLHSGIHFVMPFLDRPRCAIWTSAREEGRNIVRYTHSVDRIDLREAVYDFPKQNVITKDNVTMEISALLYYQITDPKAALYEVSNLPHAIEKLTQTTLRNIVGSLDLDESLTSRDQVNQKLRLILDDATDKWGVKVNRVELQEVTPPADIRAAMEKQMRAERERRAMILEAEGAKQATILEAEGEKSSKVTRAEGEATAKLLLAQAEADSIKIIHAAAPNGDPLAYQIATQYIKALPEITKDKQGKMIILPYESSALMGSLATIKEIFKQ
jgi:regulator of protease activity HflC (stomatin/prohibitin superfamily)